MIIVIVWLLSIAAAWYIARRNQRNEGTAVFLAILFGWFAVIGYALAGKPLEVRFIELAKLQEKAKETK